MGDLNIINRIAARGDGVTASGDFVSGTAPGDMIVDGKISQRGEHYREPPCQHFGSCGGCQLQHISDEAYAAFCHDRIIEALAAHDIAPPEMRPTYLSPPHSRRRVALRADKRGHQITLGYAQKASNKLVDVRACPVMHPQLFAMLAPLRALFKTVMPDKRVFDIQMTLADQGVDILISGPVKEGLEARSALTDFAQTHQLARLSIDEGYGAEPAWEPDPAMITLSGIPVALPSGAFLQATADGEDALVDAVRAALPTAQTVTDLFAGIGTFSFGVDSVEHAVEGARASIMALQAAANREQLRLFCDHRDLFRRPMTAKELARFDGIIIDPPRAGAKDQMTEIAASTAKEVAAVSCNPSTFARDARILVDGGYTLNWIQPVGQFRWSTHVELVAAFSR